MKPVDFQGRNVIFAKDQPEYRSLPAKRKNDDMGTVVSCWELTFKERLKVLFTGKIWMALASFGKPLTPSLLTTDKEEVL